MTSPIPEFIPVPIRQAKTALETLDAIAFRIKAIRLLKKMTHKQLARQCKVHVRTIQLLEKGKGKNESAQIGSLVKVLTFLNAQEPFIELITPPFQTLDEVEYWDRLENL